MSEFMFKSAVICPKNQIGKLLICLRLRITIPNMLLRLIELAGGNVNGVKIMHLADFLLSEGY